MTTAQPSSSSSASSAAFAFSPAHSPLTSSASSPTLESGLNNGDDAESQEVTLPDVPTPTYSPSQQQDDAHPLPQFGAASSDSNSTRPPLLARGHSYATGSASSTPTSDPFAADRQRRVSYPATSVLGGGGFNNSNGSTTASSPLDDKGIWGSAGRTARAASDGLLLSTGFVNGGVSSGSRLREKSDSDTSSSAQQEQQKQAAFFRAHERRSLETSAHARLASSIASSVPTPTATMPVTSELDRDSLISPPLPSNASSHATSFFQQQAHSTSSLPLTPLLSPTAQSPPTFTPAQAPQQQQQQLDATSTNNKSQESIAAAARAQSASLHLGDLDVWMDEAYVRECCTRMGWDGVTNIKMIRGASPSSGYCFLTFPSAAHAAQVLARFNASPPTLMPRSSRTFKLNWGTGLPGLQPRWDGEFSVFVGDLGREVGEADLVALFTPLFPSTKSAKVMCDPSTGLSRGYGFVRFADENDMERALLLGQNAGSGLSLHGRTLRISEASGPNNEKDRTAKAKIPGSNGDSAPNSSFAGFQGRQDVNGAYGDFLNPSQAAPFSPNGPMSPLTTGASAVPARTGPLSPGFLNNNSNANQSSHSSDPNNTTVFVGGLPACISEETLKSFFHHFGEITYCKIPTGKGCGFVQFVRRADAELAIAKMNDFPIHGKSRIRLSWGRSQGDKQVEHVRKLASALGVPFEAVWRMVQGQDNTTIKQIATAVNGNGSSSSSAGQQSAQAAMSHADQAAQASARFSSMGVGRMDLGAVASAAGLSEAEVLDLVSGRTGQNSNGNNSTDRSHSSSSDFFGRSSSHASSAPSSAAHAYNNSNGHDSADPYSRVSPSSFSAFSPANSMNGLPMSPPPSAGSSFAMNQMQYQQQQHYGMAPSPYAPVRSDPYAVHSPTSPYDRVDFADGHMAGARGDRYMPPGPGAYGRFGGAGYGGDAYGQPGLEDAFANLNFGASASPLPPRGLPPHLQQQQQQRGPAPHMHQPQAHYQHQMGQHPSFSSAAHEFYPSSSPAPGQQEHATSSDDGSSLPRSFFSGGGDGGAVGEAQWGGGWGNVRA